MLLDQTIPAMQEFEYNVSPAYSSNALSEWQFQANASCRSLVIPDGCQDIIVKQGCEADKICFVTEFSHSAYNVPSTVGVFMKGIRLQPGITIHTEKFNAWLANNDPDLLFGSDQLDEFCSRSDSLTEALNCLAADASTVLFAAKELGVSIRSLQRLIKSETGLPPGFWFALARARKAARALLKNENLSDTAYTAGYSDQSHLNRDMKRWFTQTPVQIRNNTEMHSALLETGYG